MSDNALRQPRAKAMKNDTQAAPALALRSEALFAGRQMIVIEHAGKRYQLRLISANKLLLTA